MQLSQYLESHKNSDLARRLGVSVSVVSHWKSGFRPVPLEHCASIERATEGKVQRWDLRPDDWWVVWPELLLRPDAPKLTTAA